MIDVIVNRRGLHLGAADALVEAEVTEAHHFDRFRLAWPMAYGLDAGRVEIIRVKRAKDIVPDDLVRRLRIVHVNQRKRQPGLVVHEISLRREHDLGRVLFGGRFVRRGPLKV